MRHPVHAGYILEIQEVDELERFLSYLPRLQIQPQPHYVLYQNDWMGSVTGDIQRWARKHRVLEDELRPSVFYAEALYADSKQLRAWLSGRLEDNLNHVVHEIVVSLTKEITPNAEYKFQNCFIEQIEPPIKIPCNAYIYYEDHGFVPI
jgi:hypothetical protein